jgi:hypothetical protein
LQNSGQKAFFFLVIFDLFNKKQAAKKGHQKYTNAKQAMTGHCVCECETKIPIPYYQLSPEKRYYGCFQ